MNELRIDAYAKLALSLRIVGVHRDGSHDGYHEIDALMVSLNDPHDSLALRVATVTSVAVDGPFGTDVPTDENNLAWRAAAALGATAEITINKGIPPGAGLGGGSADAAAVLCGLRALYDLAVSDDELARIGAALGADVPFCLRGGAARVRGVGEIVEPTAIPELHVVIATPAFGCSTVAVYQAWDRLGGPVGRTVDPGIAQLGSLANDLEAAAHAVEPRLADFRDVLEHAAGRQALLAGSGSSYFFVVAGRAVAEAVHEAVSGIAHNLTIGATAPAGVRLQAP